MKNCGEPACERGKHDAVPDAQTNESGRASPSAARSPHKKPKLDQLAGWRLVPILVSSLFLVGTTHALQAQAPQIPPPSVMVDVVRTQNVATKTEFIGRLESVQAVDVIARVSGLIQQVAFREGQTVSIGSPLFIIEPDQYRALVAQAEAQVASATATLRNATVAYERRLSLVRSDAVSKSDLDAALASRDTAQAAVSLAEAQLEIAKLNLGYTQISSPISGRVGKANLTLGNYVTPNSSALARIVQLDPIRVVFSVSERDALAVQEKHKSRDPEKMEAAFVPTLRLANNEVSDQKGRIVFFGNEVDSNTGTVPVWAEFANPDGLLLPGGTVYVSISPSEARLMPVVPIAAVQETRQGKQVLVVDAQGKVAVRPITVSSQVGQNWVVESGLVAGETIMVDGFQKVRPGIVVHAVGANTSGAKP